MRFLTLLATAALALPATAPAHAAARLCDASSLQAAGTDSAGLADIAVTHWRCVDPSLSAHTSQLVWQWWYFTDDYAFGTIDACPTTTAPAVTYPWAGALTLAATAECRQPAGSPGYGEHRIVCVDMLLDGVPLYGTSPFTNGACADVTAIP